jgi:hypothetical protein
MSISIPEQPDTLPLGALDSPDLQRWLDEELRTIDLGDKRRNDRCRLILHRLCRHPNFKFNAACDGDSEMDAAYRFVHNRSVSEQGIFAPHFTATKQRIKQHPVVLLVNDTTENDLTRRHERLQGAGPLQDTTRWGLFVHPLLAFTPTRIPLGLVDVHIWARDPASLDRSAQEKAVSRKITPIEEKESIRWINSYNQACQVAAACPETQIIYVGDSEADIFELFYAARPVEGVNKAELLVRACQDRALTPLADATEQPMGLLFAEVASSKVLATMEVEVSENHGKPGDSRKRRQPRSARKTTVTIQAKRVQLRMPARPNTKEGSAFTGMTHVEVNAVLVREVNPPAGEEAIEWLLLTTLAIDTLAQVKQVIEFYCVRWQIEIYFRVLKSGCEIEKSQLETAARYKKYLALSMIVAWRVMYVMMLGRTCPDMACDEVLEEDEWRAVYTVVTEQKAPAKAPTLGVMLLLLASLGGFLGRPSDGEPGPKSVWRGMQRMADMVKGWRAAKASEANGQAGTEKGGSGGEGLATSQNADAATRPKIPRICLSEPLLSADSMPAHCGLPLAA